MRAQAGYNLVTLIIAVTVLNILVAVALPTWSQQIQRDKEEELISRGFQYAEAIRVFQNRFQRLPVRLEELTEVRPRCIRRLWKDPMTDSGQWKPIFFNQPAPPQPPQPPPPPPRKPGDQPKPSPSPTPGNDNDPNAPPKPGDEVATGPIQGVQSRSNKQSILVFNGKEHYDEWQFTLAMLLQGGGQPPRTQPPVPAPGGASLQLSTRWIGRPLPSFLQLRGGTMPGAGDTPPPPPPTGGPAHGPRPRKG